MMPISNQAPSPGARQEVFVAIEVGARRCLPDADPIVISNVLVVAKSARTNVIVTFRQDCCKSAKGWIVAHLEKTPS